MRALKISIARSVWLLPLSDINPTGKAIDVDLITWLRTTYQFQKYPSSAFDFNPETKALIFDGGKFKTGIEKDGKPLYVNVGLMIYQDGLVANTQSSTADSDAFLNEALFAAIKEFNLSDPGNIRKRLYYSEMDIELDKPISLINPKLEELAGHISQLRSETQDVAFEFSGISFLPQRDAQATVSSFHIERKVNTDWSENRYYTKAPLQTDAHLQLLEEFEALLTK